MILIWQWKRYIKKRHRPTVVLCNTHYIFYINVSLHEHLWQHWSSGQVPKVILSHTIQTPITELPTPATTAHHLIMPFPNLASTA